MPDINTYALSLQLNLESNAPEVLDDVSSRLDQINDQIAQIGGAFDTALGGAVENMVEATDQIASSLDQVYNSLDQSQPILEDIGDLQEERAEAWEQEFDTVERIRDGIQGMNEGLDDSAVKTAKVKRGFFDVFLGIEAIKTAFAEFLELEEDFITANYRLYGAQEQIVRQVNDISDQYDLLRGTAQEAMKSLAISLRVPRDELAKYVAQVSVFNRATGASIQQTSDWIRSMTLAGFTSRDTERSLARMVLMMRQAGFTTEQINKQLEQEIALSSVLATRYGKEGVDAYQDMAMANMAMTRQVHGNADAMQRFNEALVSNVGLQEWAKSLSTLTTEELAGMNAAQQEMALIQDGMFGVVQEFDRATAGLTTAQARMVLDQLGAKFGVAGQDAMDLVQSFRELESQGIVDRESQLAAMGPVLEKLKEEQALMNEFGDAMNTVKAAWETALRPLFNAWINLMIALKPVMLFIVDLVGILADVLAFLINTLAAIINPVAAFKRNLEGVNEAGEEAVGFFKRLGSGVLNLAQALPALIFGMAVLVGLYYGLRLISQLFINWVNQMRPANLMALATAFLAVGASMLMMATALAIIAALGWKAAGALVVLTAAMAGMVVTITFLANVARTATVPLTVLAGVMLAFGATAMMMAGAVWIVADALKSMADLGWEKLFIGLTGVVGILAAFGAVLVVLGYAALPVWPAILAIGAAFLMMGAAIWMTAAAFEMIVDSFGKLGESAMKVVENAGALFIAVGIISAALLALAAVGAITAIPLLALGVALLVVGAAAMMISSAFEAAAEAIKAFADIENVKDAIAGMALAMTAMMFTMAGISLVLAPILPLMLMTAGVLLAVGAAAWLTAQAMDVMAGAMEKFGDMEMIAAGVAGLAVAMMGMAAVALVIAPVLPAMILMGVAMMSIGAGAWLMAQGLSAAAKAIQELAEIDTTEILQVGWDLLAFGTMVAGAATMLLWGSLLMAPAAAALTYAVGALAAALWLLPVSRLRVIGEAMADLGNGFQSFASGLDQIESIATEGGSFGELATTISSALDEIEEQALRADAVADSFVRMNEAIAQALAGPPEPVYGEVADALRDRMDAIEEQAARAEAVYAPIEGIAEQAELALAMSGEPAPEATAESVVGGLAPGTEEDMMALSNFTNLRKQTDLLEKLLAATEPRTFADAAHGLLQIPGRIGEEIREIFENVWPARGDGAQPAAERGAGE